MTLEKEKQEWKLVRNDDDSVAFKSAHGLYLSNTLIAASGDTITARARWLVRNNGYAANAIESWAANTVGDGISPNSSIEQSPRKDAVQRLWLAWTDDADAEGLTDFYGLQRRAACAAAPAAAPSPWCPPAAP